MDFKSHWFLNIFWITEFNSKTFGEGIEIIGTFVSKNDIDTLHGISLIRNLIIHNNSIVNRIYIKEISRISVDQVEFKSFNEGDTILSKLEDLVEKIRVTSTRVCEKIAEAIINDSQRLKSHHENLWIKPYSW